MDTRNSKGRNGFWEVYRVCAEENRVASDRSPFYVNWAKTFANFLPGKPLKDRTGKDIEAFLADLGDLDAYRDSQRLTGFIFETTVTVTIHYSDADVKGLDEKMLRLYRWVSPNWQVVGAQPGEGQLPPDTDNNVLTAWLRSLSRFGDLGVSKYDTYLPIIIRNK